MNRIILAALVVGAVCAAAIAPAQKWTQMPNTPNIGGFNPTLMTDGTVIVQDGDNDVWYKLTPDKSGSYLNGTWTQLPQTPGYGPLYYASAVTADGRLVTIGGEYNMGSGTVWQNQGYIYDPVKNSWSFLPAPTGWNNIGDMGAITLPNGKIMMMQPFTSQGALFDPTTGSFTVPYGTGKLDGNDEEGLTLLPDGTILTVDTTPNRSEIFNPKTGVWSDAGKTPALLVGLGEEIGPQVLRYDGTVLCCGGGSHNCVYNTKTKTWSTAPDFPTVGSVAECCADAPGCLLTNGNVLVMCGPPSFGAGAVFLEWDGKAFNTAPTTANAPSEPSFVGNMLMLPTGEVMLTDQSPTILLYTSAGAPNPAWAPTITSSPISVTGGGSYSISGTQFNGLSGSSAYGDDQQNYTNYPLIRITNNKTGDVTYCKEFNPSTFAICTGTTIVSTNFLVPKTIEQGSSTIQVVTNGIPSKAVAIVVGPPIQGSGVSVFTGTYVHGSTSSVFTVDGNTYAVKSMTTAGGLVAAVEVDFNLPSSSITGLNVNATASAKAGVTGMLYLWDFKASAWVYLTPSVPVGAKNVTMGGAATGDPTRFVGPNGLVKVVVRAIQPTRTANGQYTLSVDQVYVD